MKKNIYLGLLIIALLSSCSSPEQKSTFISIDSLPVSKFEISLDRDTILKTSKGAIIKIPKGTFVSETKTSITLTVKEAYDAKSMLLAGLTTKSGEDILSSGGMFYIGCEDSALYTFNGKISVSVPTSKVNPLMKLFKGDEKDGSVDWKSPSALNQAADTASLRGQNIFNANCASCHAIGSEKIGPDLAYISERRSNSWLMHFTNESQRIIRGNNEDAISPFSFYANCLYRKYNYTEMTSFSLTDNELNELYDYINDFSYQNKLAVPEDTLYHCVDSCTLYFELYQKRSRLVAGNEKNKYTNKTNNTNQIINSTPTQITNIPVDNQNIVTAFDYTPEYYQVEITTFGWYNIDILLKDIPGIEDCNFQIDISDNEKYKVVLLVPTYNVIVNGGLMPDSKNYAFYKDDGAIPLPVGKEAYVIAIREEKENVWFYLNSFAIKKQQVLSISPKSFSAQEVNNQLKNLNIKDFTMQVKESINNKKIKQIDLELEKLDLMRPKNCDCDCVGRFE